MHNNTHRFTGRAADYDLYRQRYPVEEILSHLRDWCGLMPAWVIADVGAGTSMLAEVFLANGNPVLAIEPNTDMRNQMRPSLERHFGRTVSQLQIIDATAEATTLPNASVDIVAAGRAFHWFDKGRSLQEFRRILKPGGWVALIAADRDRDTQDPLYRKQMDAYERLMSEHGTDYTRVRSGYRAYQTEESFIGKLHRARICEIRQLDWTAFSGYASSLSVIPRPADPGHEAFAKALHEHFDAYATDGILTIPTICWINAGRLGIE